MKYMCLKYSKRKRNRGSLPMPDQIPESLKAERSSILMELAERQKKGIHSVL